MEPQFQSPQERVPEPHAIPQTSFLRTTSGDQKENTDLQGIEDASNESSISLESSRVGESAWSTTKSSSRTALAEQTNGVSSITNHDELGVLGVTTSYLRPTRSKQSLKDDQSQTVVGSQALPRLLRTFSSNSDRPLTSSSHTPTVSSSPILSAHLIPSRRSSLRHSTTERPRSKESKRMSTSSYDLKNLNIDQSLIEENYSAVKRIRELQEAKEKRHQEWRREARKSEKTKRHSMPSPRMLAKATSNSSSQPIVGIVVEVPDNLGKPGSAPTTDELSNRRTSRDLVNGMVTTLNRASSNTARSVLEKNNREVHNILPKSPPKHRRGMSAGLRRSFTSPAILSESLANTQVTIDEEVDRFLASPRLTQKIRHPRTGRTIAFSEVGDPKGFVVICCVGMGLTRYLMAFYDELARTSKLRLITPDRPGIGESQPHVDGHGTPLSWADDIYVLCQHLDISKFSLLAHSAGAIYALATALRLPQYVRGRLHLLAPWIPPSQVVSMGRSQQSPPMTEIPFTQRLLGVLPASFLKVANASFMSATSASISPRARSKRRSGIAEIDQAIARSIETDLMHRPSLASMSAATHPQSTAHRQGTNETFGESSNTPAAPSTPSTSKSRPHSMTSPVPLNALSPAAHRALYNDALTHRIWSLATRNANPAVDLLVCLERRTTIGFKYTDVTRSVVIRHGSEDTRVSIENVKWLGKVMKRCEVRVLEGEGHGLMANAGVMSDVLGEVGREWEEWARVVRGKEGKKVKEKRRRDEGM